MGQMTQSQQFRCQSLNQYGCFACEKLGKRLAMPVEIHHARDTGRKISHDHLNPLCSWHHRAVCFDGWTAQKMLDAFGPTVHGHGESWKLEHGSERGVAEYLQERVA